jgi:hypothetical protein
MLKFLSPLCLLDLKQSQCGGGRDLWQSYKLIARVAIHLKSIQLFDSSKSEAAALQGRAETKSVDVARLSLTLHLHTVR